MDAKKQSLLLKTVDRFIIALIITAVYVKVGIIYPKIKNHVNSSHLKVNKIMLLIVVNTKYIVEAVNHHV